MHVAQKKFCVLPFVVLTRRDGKLITDVVKPTTPPISKYHSWSQWWKTEYRKNRGGAFKPSVLYPTTALYIQATLYPTNSP